jgi:hypothetical protein
MRGQKSGVLTDLVGKWVMPVKRPPLKSVTLKALNFESGCVIADAMAENVTEVEQRFSKICPIWRSGSQVKLYINVRRSGTTWPRAPRLPQKE